MLQEAGTVLHLARSGRLIIKASVQVNDNTILVDEKGRRACKVMEMIGPVANPYFSAMPLTDRTERIIGTKLYISDERAAPSYKSGDKKRQMNRADRRRISRNATRK